MQLCKLFKETTIKKVIKNKIHLLLKISVVPFILVTAIKIAPFNVDSS